VAYNATQKAQHDCQRAQIFPYTLLLNASTDQMLDLLEFTFGMACSRLSIPGLASYLDAHFA